MPIEKSEIRTLIPHAGLMCLLDSVLKWDDESIVCRSETHRDPTNPLRRDGQLSALHALEYSAQAAAVHGGLRARSAGGVAPPGYFAPVPGSPFHGEKLGEIPFPIEGRPPPLLVDTRPSGYLLPFSVGGALFAD